ncbi:MAG: penicillin-binding protein A [Ruminococcaceae bacterium]|nr:penicillin-binding protein A [Oscillospiraceae bacterium]
MDQNEHPRARLYLLAVFLIVILLAYLGVLFDTQVLHHEEYLARSLHSIASEETVEASRGLITDRNGRTLVSNASAYDLTFDAGALKEGQDQNEAILRLIRLCESQNVIWEENLPISGAMPYTYTLHTSSDIQKGRFLTYLLSIKETKKALGEYLLAHPELVPTAEEESPAEPAADGDDVPAFTPEQQAAEALKRFPASALTAKLLNDAGITAHYVITLMSEAMGLPESLSLTEQRQVLGVRYELALRKLDNYSSYVLAENVDIAFISMINDGAYAGAKITTSTTRQYETAYAAHILGTVSRIYREDLERLQGKGYDGNDWIGRSGVEAAFEDYLRGTDGRRVVSVNSDGKITGEYYEKQPRPGHTVELTIDLRFQQAVEDALAETVSAMNAEDGLDDRGAGAAVIKVGTGEVLAIASYPTYDLATYRQEYETLAADPANPMFNRATQGTYAPGSTLKPLTAVAALEEGKTTLTERIRDTGRWVYPNDPTESGAWCWNRYGHGLENVTSAITDSCNYFFAEMGYRLGMTKLTEYLSAFGLGEKTGIEIGDRAGTLPQNQQGEDQTPWAAFGQGNQLYTPLQLANYIATLVSGGEHCDAHLLKSVKTYDNTEIVALGNTTPTNTIQIKDSTLNAVKQGMRDLTTIGDLSVYFKDCVVSAGAKTGTAQVGSDQVNNGVFVCFAPYDKPEIAVAIVIEKGGKGSALASTAVNILNAYFSADEIGLVITGENQLIP